MTPGDESGAAAQQRASKDGRDERAEQRCIKAAGGGTYDPLSRVGGLSGVCVCVRMQVVFMLL